MFTGRVTGELDGVLASWPAESLPQPRPEPSVPRTAAVHRPAVTPARYTLLIPVTRSGVEWSVSVPSPSCPELLPPHVHTEASTVMPLVWVATAASKPAAMPAAWVKPVTLAGTELETVVPLPSWPCLLSPQAHTVPSERRARPKPPPAEILVTPVSPVTWTGTRSTVVPLLPHVHTVPSDRRARLK